MKMDKTTDNHEAQDTNDWSEEEVKEIMSKVIHATGNKNFNYEIKKIDWNALKMEGRDPETCKAMFLKLTHNIRKHRTVTEILNDVSESLSKSITKLNTNFAKPLTGYFMFIQDKEGKLKEKHPDMSRKERLSKLLKRWNKSEAIRSQYQEKYKILYEEYKSKVGKLDHENAKEKKSGPKLPTPFSLFNLKRRAREQEENPEMDWRQITASLKSKYHKLSDKKKFRFMNKALEKMSEYKKELEAYKQTHPDFQAKADELPLTKEEKTILNDKFPRPPPVPLNTYQYYCSKERPKLSGVNVADHSRQLAASYNELKEDTRLEYQAEFKKCVEEHIEKLVKYQEQMAPWSERTAQEVNMLIEKYQRALVPKKKRKKSRARRVENGSNVSATGQKRKAKEASDEGEDSDEEVQSKKKKKTSEKGTPMGVLSKSLFGSSSHKSGSKSSSSESEESDSDKSNKMPPSFRISPLKSPKKES